MGKKPSFEQKIQEYERLCEIAFNFHSEDTKLKDIEIIHEGMEEEEPAEWGDGPFEVHTIRIEGKEYLYIPPWPWEDGEFDHGTLFEPWTDHDNPEDERFDWIQVCWGEEVMSIRNKEEQENGK